MNTYLDNGNLPFYWEEDNNMLGKLSDIERSNYSGRLKGLIKKFDDNWEKNPAFIGQCIGQFASQLEIELLFLRNILFWFQSQKQLLKSSSKMKYGIFKLIIVALFAKRAHKYLIYMLYQ